jgi:hypothetical protein
MSRVDRPVTQTALVAVKKASIIGIGLPVLEIGNISSKPPITMAKAKLSSKKRFEFIAKSGVLERW